jgi:hypothetical protein
LPSKFWQTLGDALTFSTTRIQHYEEGAAEETRKVDLNNIEEHRMAADATNPPRVADTLLP